MTEWTALKFGRYWGRTLPWLLWHDPDYFFWGYEEGVFRDDLLREAEELYWKATHILPPKPYPEGTLVEYIVHPSDGKFCGLNLVEEANGFHIRSANAVLHDPLIDLSVPRGFAIYDKKGYRLFVRTLKFHLFGSSTHRMTERRCCEFFEDETNFAGCEDAV
jgi:hypothetical protein